MGVAVIYGSASLSLAALEYLVHIDIEDVPDDLVALGIDVPDDAAQVKLAEQDLPADWRRPGAEGCAGVGDDWITGGAALTLAVPSAIVPEEDNVLINPGHARAGELRVGTWRPFSYDPRLL